MRAIRAIAFVVFFSIGAVVLSATVLCDDFVEFFHKRSWLKHVEEDREKSRKLNADYDAVIAQFESDPCQLARLAPATLGIEPNEPNTVYPRASADKLAAARKALIEQPQVPIGDEAVPEWLDSCCRWPRRHILFFCGAALMLIAFIFFGPPARSGHSMTVTSKAETSRPDGGAKK